MNETTAFDLYIEGVYVRSYRTASAANIAMALRVRNGARDVTWYRADDAEGSVPKRRNWHGRDMGAMIPRNFPRS